MKAQLTSYAGVKDPAGRADVLVVRMVETMFRALEGSLKKERAVSMWPAFQREAEQLATRYIGPGRARLADDARPLSKIRADIRKSARPRRRPK